MMNPPLTEHEKERFQQLIEITVNSLKSRSFSRLSASMSDGEITDMARSEAYFRLALDEVESSIFNETLKTLTTEE